MRGIRVFCPYTTLHPRTRSALVEHAPDAEVMDLGTSHDAYYNALSELWRGGKTFLVVEHDIEIHEGVLPQLRECDEPWCLFPYRGPEDVMLTSSLGCTLFSAELLARHPQVMAELPVRDWRRLDCELSPRLMQLGYEPHVHEPMVLHHHVRENGRCDCREEHG